MLVMDRYGNICKIERYLESIVDDMLALAPQLSIPLHRRKLLFPGKVPDDARRFTIVFRILTLMHEALRTNVIWTKRDIFYKDPALFLKQRVVDDFVDEIACTLGVSRNSLNVVATAKGLAAGAFTMYRTNGISLCGTIDREGILIPAVQGTETFDLTGVRWILVVEKDATYQALTSSRLWAKISTQGIVLTAKGYPDLATRQLLHQISVAPAIARFKSARDLRVYGLFDYDPDGMAIFSIYQSGSVRLAHEVEHLVCSQLQLLGVNSGHVFGELYEYAQQGLLELSQRDRKRAVSMLEWRGGMDAYDLNWHRELQVMLVVGLKAEVQMLHTREGGLVKWLEERIIF